MEFETEATVKTPVRNETPSDGRSAEFIKIGRPTIVTTSFDDGDRCDLKVAEILRARNVAGTFYVPITPHEQHAALGHPELRDLLSEGFEIGAHGLSHKPLWKISQEELAKEIVPCRPILEDILGSEVRMFCYPKGRYDSNTIRALQEAGFLGARTNRMLATQLDFNPFAIPTTVQISMHPKYDYIKNVVRAGRIEGLRLCLTHMTRLHNWVELGKKIFDSVLENGGIWHLYGHSREIEDLGMWKDLEEMLDYVCNRKGVMYVPNCDLVRFSCAQGPHAGNSQP